MKLSFLSLIAVVLVFVGCSNDHRPPAKKFKTIKLSTSGKIEVIPDEATLYLQLECLDKNIEQSKTCLIEQSQEITTLLKSFEIQEEDIQTTRINQSKSYSWENYKQVFKGYLSSTSIHLKVRKIETLDKIYTALLGKEEVNINYQNLSHSKIDSLEHEAYLKALNDASMLAKKLANKAGGQDIEVLKMGNVNFTSSNPQGLYMANNESNAMLKEDKSFKSKEVQIHHGKITVSANLIVEYLIK